MKAVPPMRRARGEMLPLMDMIFLLLVMFIFQIIQMRPDFGISVELPDVGRSHITPPDKQQTATVTVSITTDNRLYVNADEVPFETLVEAVRARAEGAPDENISIILRGDEQADYGHIMRLFTLLRQNNLKKVVFDVDTTDEANPNPIP